MIDDGPFGSFRYNDMVFDRRRAPVLAHSSIDLPAWPTDNRTFHNTIESAIMNALNANDLKVGGVTAIETALQNEPEVAISVRGERRYVVMSTAQYEHLRECELEAAWLTSQADRGAGRARAMTAAQHIADMQKTLQKPAGAPNVPGVQQERAGYKAGKTRDAKSAQAIPIVQSRKSSQTKTKKS